jgi:hypothetical protein
MRRTTNGKSSGPTSRNETSIEVKHINSNEHSLSAI